MKLTRVMCPNDNQIRDFLVGRIESQQADLLAGHIENCSRCSARLAAMDRDTPIDDQPETVDRPRFTDESECEKLIESLRSTQKSAEQDTVEFTTDTLHGVPGKLGEYVIEGELGRGGMGHVFAGHHGRLGTPVAIKLIRADRSARPDALRRFERELIANGQLNHANVVGTIDAGNWNGNPYLVMERVDGVDLSKLLERTGPLATKEVAELARQVALGLGAIHQTGRVHRDIKPSNIMIDRSGRVRLLDLGLARAKPGSSEGETCSGAHEFSFIEDSLDAFQGHDHDRTHDSITVTNQVVGTLEYLAPEQVLEPAKTDQRSDVFAFGVTLFRALTGEPIRPPTSGPQSILAWKAILELPIVPIKRRRHDVPDAFAVLIDQSLSYDMDERPTLEQLRDVASGLAGRDGTVVLSKLVQSQFDHFEKKAPQQTSLAESKGQAKVPWRLPLGWVAAVVILVAGLIWFGPTWTPPAADNLLMQAKDATQAQDPAETVDESESAAEVDRENDAARPVTPFAEVDLMKLVEPDRDIRGDDWIVDGDSFVSTTQRPSLMQFPYALPPSYQLELTAERIGEPDGISLVLPLKGSMLWIQIDGWPQNGTLTGIDHIRGRRINRRRDPHVGRLIATGKPIPIIANVMTDEGQISVTVDVGQKRVIDWEGPAVSLRNPAADERTDPRVPAIKVYKTAFRVSDVRLKPLANGGEPIEFADRQTDPQLAVRQWIEWKGGKLTSDDATGSLGAVSVPGNLWFGGKCIGLFDGIGGIESLNLQGIAIDAATLETLGLPNLSTLRLSEARFERPPRLSSKFLPGLESLDLSQTVADQSSLSSLSRMPKLAVLKARNTAVRSLDPSRFPTSLRHLDLSQTAIDGDALAGLPTMPDLTHLILNQTRVDHADAITPARFPSLKHLELIDSQITAVADQQLASRFPDAKRLTGFGGIDLVAFAATMLGRDESAAIDIIELSDTSTVSCPIMIRDSYQLRIAGTAHAGGPLTIALPPLGGRDIVIEFDPNERSAGIKESNGRDVTRSKTKARVPNVRNLPDDQLYRAYAAANLNRVRKAKAKPRPFDLSIEVDLGEKEIQVHVKSEQGPLASQRFPIDQNAHRRAGYLQLACSSGDARLGKASIQSSQAVTRHGLPVSYGNDDRDMLKWLLDTGGYFRGTQTDGVRLSANECDYNRALAMGAVLPSLPLSLERVLLHSRPVRRDTFERLGRMRSIKNLEIRGSTFREADVAPLARLESLESLNVKDDQVGKVFVGTISKLPRLTTLKLKSQKLSSNDVASLARNRRLQTLHLVETQLDSNALETLASLSNLTELSVAGSQIGGDGLSKLQACRKLQVLDISRCENIQAEHLWRLNVIPSLRVLRASGIQFDEPAGMMFAALKGVTTLDLSRTNLTDEDFKQIALLETLGALDASHTAIGPGGLKALSDCRSLRKLNLTGAVNVTDSEIETIANMVALGEVDLSGSGVSVEAAFELQRRRPRMRVRRFGESDLVSGSVNLNLRGKPVTDQTLPWAIRETKPYELSLSGPEITDRSAPAIAKSPLRRLHLSGTAVTSRGMMEFGSMTRMWHLILNDMPQLDERLGSALARMPNLSFLQITRCGNGSLGLAQLKNRGMQIVEISDERIDRQFILSDLVPIGTLPTLSIKHAALRDSDLSALAGLRITRRLNLNDCPGIDGSGLADLPGHDELRGLGLAGCPVTDQGLKSIEGWPEIEFLGLRETKVTPESIPTLQSLRRLKDVFFSAATFDADQRRQIEQGLPGCLRPLVRGEVVADADNDKSVWELSSRAPDRCG